MQYNISESISCDSDCKGQIALKHCVLLYAYVFCRTWRRPLSAIIRLHWWILLCSPLLDQNLQTRAPSGGSLYQTTQERFSWAGDFPEVWLCKGPVLQSVERCYLLLQSQTPRVPEDLTDTGKVSPIRLWICVFNALWHDGKIQFGTQKNEECGKNLEHKREVGLNEVETVKTKAQPVFPLCNLFM